MSDDSIFVGRADTLQLEVYCSVVNLVKDWYSLNCNNSEVQKKHENVVPVETF